MVEEARHPRILVVDDDAPVRTLVRRILVPRLFDLLEAESLDAALALVSNGAPPVDLLLTDVVMPRGTGPALAVRLHEKWPGLPVLYMSGYPRDTLAKHGLTAEDAFLLKPFTPQTLREGIARLLGHGAA